jgi:hypothetical protein
MRPPFAQSENFVITRVGFIAGELDSGVEFVKFELMRVDAFGA